MSDFADDFDAALEDIDIRIHAVFDAAVELMKQSIQFGSSITGSPGQPVDTGNLRNAWIRENPSENVSIVSTNVEYAQSIEDGIGPHGPLTLRSAVGGFHSVALTVAGFDLIMSAAMQARQ